MSQHNFEVGSMEMAEFKPNRETYVKIEQAGLIRLFTAREEKGKLVGYAIFLVAPHLHYSDLIWAQQDVFFMERGHRGVGAYRFLKWIDEELSELGVNVILRTVTEKKDYSRTLEKNGYKKTETTYLRRMN